MTTVADWFGLTGEQKDAATGEADEILVTAGAGSGKTRTLVARYLWLLESGLSLRQIAAITFTEKAAREMRNRVRAALGDLARSAADPAERQRWAGLEAGIDAARIGTIHGLCAEILRTHPAEAGVDPMFAVIEEGLGAAAKANAVEDALAWATEDEAAVQLYQYFNAGSLRSVLARLMARRLEASPILAASDITADPEASLDFALRESLHLPSIQASLAALQAMVAGGSLEGDAGPALAEQIQDLLDRWQAAESNIKVGKFYEAACFLFDARRECMDLRRGSKDSHAKEHLRALREAYDERLGSWLGGGKKDDLPPDPEADSQLGSILPLLAALYKHAHSSYTTTLAEGYQLDFDDLESGALELLRQPEVRERWSNEIQAILVDEFQDTNERQREIIEALAGGGKLFVVGDARQSIYRFRGADVTVFRAMQREVGSRQGTSLELQTTFRSHRGLLSGLDSLLPRFMGEAEAGMPLYQVPYTRLNTDRDEPAPGVSAPHLELIVGLGERAADARVQAAGALARRLLVLREAGQFESWDQVTLLFRASTGFPAYEAAFAAYGIPFVTVAGGGFYERPEIRDVLNILHTIAEPWDDVALAGMLRSPAFGLTDASLYRLRFGPAGMRTLAHGIADDQSNLPETDRAVVERANAFLAEMTPLVERVPVAEVLKRLIDGLDYRAILAARGERLWRNLDKLLEDARASGLVRVSAFFEYMATVRETGVREGEAPAEAIGAARLMTIHKAKGLEFDLVVLADASRQPMNRAEPAYLLPEIGLAVKPDKPEVTPLAYAISRWYDGLQSDAEENRILYVACTRAREKLIISGHLAQNRGNWSANGWMKELFGFLELDPDQIAGTAGGEQVLDLGCGVEMGLHVDLPLDLPVAPEEAGDEWPTSKQIPLVEPIPLIPVARMDQDLARDPERDWRATGGSGYPPAAVVGLIVHAALRSWLFPGDLGLDPLLETEALSAGLVEPRQRERAVHEAEKLLDRLKKHHFFAQISGSDERHHELPYTRPHASWGSDSGRIDLLYRLGEDWHLVDFKIDELRNKEDLVIAVEEHRPQLKRYAEAVQVLLGVQPSADLCFLDAIGEVKVVPV